MSTKSYALLGIVFFGFFLLMNSVFTVNETQQTLVLQFGEIKKVHQTPGLKFKIPFVQNTATFDKRVLNLEPPVEQVILADQKRLDVDSFVRYRIENPLLFFQSVGNEVVAQQRLTAVVNGSLRRVLGNVALLDVLSEKRIEIMDQINQQVNQEAKALGILIVDVRIRRADLPSETSQAIFARMRSEREREAAEFRAQGQELAQKIRSEADKEKTIILAEAQRDAQIQMGKGDNEALTILGREANKGPEFYVFYRSLEAYKTALQDDTTMVLSPDSEFFKHFKGNNLPK